MNPARGTRSIVRRRVMPYLLGALLLPCASVAAHAQSCTLKLDLSTGSSTTRSFDMWKWVQAPVQAWSLSRVTNVGSGHAYITVTSQSGEGGFQGNLAPGESREYDGTKMLWFARCHIPDTCYLQYERADNSWAAAGRPDGALGKEYVLVRAGETRDFVTDWKYEKQRNDGTTYYGSHLRRAENLGVRPVRLQVRNAPFVEPWVTLDRVSQTFRADLMRVSCP